MPFRREILETSETQDVGALVDVAFEASGQGEPHLFDGVSVEFRRGSQSRLERGPAGKSPQTRTRLRGEANFECIASGEMEPEGPGRASESLPARWNRRAVMELRPLAHKLSGEHANS